MTEMPATGTRMTLDAFSRLPETTTPTELIHGTLTMSPAPKDTHQRLVTHIIQTLGSLVGRGELRTAPTDLYIGGDNVLQPDVFWVAPDNARCSLGDDGYWHGPPDLVVEIVSPSTEIRDRGIKYDLYEQYGVREYWLVDPDVLFVEVYAQAGDRFERRGVFAADDTFGSDALDIEVKVNTLLASGQK